MTRDGRCLECLFPEHFLSSPCKLFRFTVSVGPRHWLFCPPGMSFPPTRILPGEPSNIIPLDSSQTESWLQASTPGFWGASRNQPCLLPRLGKTLGKLRKGKGKITVRVGPENHWNVP